MYKEKEKERKIACTFVQAVCTAQRTQQISPRDVLFLLAERGGSLLYSIISLCFTFGTPLYYIYIFTYDMACTCMFVAALNI